MMEILHRTFEEPLDLELGGQIERPTVAYSTLGTLNAQKDNVTLVCHVVVRTHG